MGDINGPGNINAQGEIRNVPYQSEPGSSQGLLSRIVHGASSLFDGFFGSAKDYGGENIGTVQKIVDYNNSYYTKLYARQKDAALKGAAFAAKAYFSGPVGALAMGYSMLADGGKDGEGDFQNTVYEKVFAAPVQREKVARRRARELADIRARHKYREDRDNLAAKLKAEMAYRDGIMGQPVGTPIIDTPRRKENEFEKKVAEFASPQLGLVSGSGLPQRRRSSLRLQLKAKRVKRRR